MEEVEENKDSEDEGYNDDSDKNSSDEDEDNGIDDENDSIPKVKPVNSDAFVTAPAIDAAKVALANLSDIICPHRSGDGYKNPHFDLLLRRRLERMQMFLRIYTNPETGTSHGWTVDSLQTSKNFGGGPTQARRLREWTQAFILDHEDLPMNIYGTWNESILEDKDLAQELSVHLQGIGKNVVAMDIV